MSEPQAGCRVRAARLEDLAQIERLLGAAGLPEAGLAEQFPAAYAVAESAAGIVGVAGLERHGRDGLLRSVAVEAGWQGRGLGRRLVDDRLEAARSAGLRSVCLLTTTARAYFLAMGFSLRDRAQAPDGIRSSVEFASACPSEAAFLCRELRFRGR